ncbi:COP9 signalosome complex subunit 3-like isoform X1 [Haliotis rufescens]|uniref:COP9 signalosome complex subunit 3-like isoform X1 n=1 Tax=Haliotis rufescens TaxID=6454 RepID=UPI001EB003A6|nr:COP9 signalosome complex subunit 3-like isoform X1 [Haliotis rufescens]
MRGADISKMASALETYVNTVQTLSSQGNFTQLCEFISKSADILAKNAAHLDTVLATLDVQQHSLGILGILCVKYNLPNIPDFEALYGLTQEFITTCNGEQVRYATDSFADLCHKFTHKLVEKKEPVRGIKVLTTAIQKIQLFPEQLTSIHADLCQLCLLSKNMKPALPFLQHDITDISREGGQFDARDFLLYYYYGGMIYTALKNYNRALYCFEVAVTTPSMAVSHIMMESYKKFILVALIVHGKIPNLPKYTSQVVARYIKPLCQAYHDLAHSYATNNPDELRTTVTKHTETFTRDNNIGLVKQCITSLYKKNIQRLTKTFQTLSLTDMANRVHLSGAKEAEKYVLHMIEDGEIYATINQKDGMVRFQDSPEKYNNATMLLQVDQEMQKCIELDEKLKTMDREITVNPQYVQKSSGSHDDDIPGSSTSKGQGY